MAKLSFTTFKGLVPRMPVHLLQETQAQQAVNCDLGFEELRPLSDLLTVQSVPAGTKSIYKYRGSWLTWDEIVDVVQAPIAQDSYDRIYYTKETASPKVRGMVSGVETEFDLGVPAPTTAPAVTANGKIAAPFTCRWFYFYEEPNGDQVDAGDLTTAPSETELGVKWQLSSTAVPAKVTASVNATFVMGFRAYDESNRLLGILYPTPSRAALNTDLEYNGATVTGNLVDTSGDKFLTLTYNTGNASQYTSNRVYVYTFVSTWGEEGPPSPPSASIAIDPTQDCLVSGLETSVAGTRNIVGIRIYRTVDSSSGTEYQLVNETDIAFGTTDYRDSVVDADTGEVLPSTNWYPPPEDLHGLTLAAGGFAVGFTDKTVWFSEPSMLHAWPASYSQAVDYDIVAVRASGNNVVVLTAGNTYFITGSSPDAMTVSVADQVQACVSGRGPVLLGDVVYPSPDGLVLATAGTVRVITQQVYDRSTWQALEPASMLGAVHDGVLYAFFTGSTLMAIIDSNGAMLSDTADAVTAVCVVPEDDIMYVVIGETLYAWNQAATYRTATWRSKNFIFPRPLAFSHVRVLADSYPVTVKLYADGTLALSLAVAAATVRTLPMLRPARNWSVAVETSDSVKELAIGQSVAEVAPG